MFLFKSLSCDRAALLIHEFAVKLRLLQNLLTQ